MKKLLIFLIALLLPLSAFTANVWEEGAGNDVISGGDSPSDIDTLLDAASTEPLTRLLKNFREGAEIEYDTASQVTVAAGEIAVQNSVGDVVAFLSNSSSTNVTFADIDTGSEASSTTYYIYAYCSDPTTDLSFSVAISTNSSAPTGISYYRRLGSFYNDSSSNITYEDVRNDGFFTTKLGGWESKSGNTVYQATTDGFVNAYTNRLNNASIEALTDGSNPPTTTRELDRPDYNARATLGFPVKKGDYWKVNEITGSATVWWIPLEIN